MVVKDRFSVRWANDKAVFGSVAYAYSAAELEKEAAERIGIAAMFSLPGI